MISRVWEKTRGLKRGRKNEQRPDYSGLSRPWEEVLDVVLKAMGNFQRVSTENILVKSTIYLQDRLKSRIDRTW